MNIINRVFDYVRQLNEALEDQEKDTEMDLNRLD